MLPSKSQPTPPALRPFQPFTSVTSLGEHKVSFWSDWTLQIPRGRGCGPEPPALAGLVPGVQISKERLQPCCAARTRREQPGADASRCFYNTSAKAPLSKCKHTLPGQAAPASDNQAHSLPGTRCQAPSTSKNEVVFTRIFKACYCLGRTHAQA